MGPRLLALLGVTLGTSGRADVPAPAFPPSVSVPSHRASSAGDLELAFEPFHLPATGASIRFAVPPLKDYPGISILAGVRTTTTDAGRAPVRLSLYTPTGTLIQTIDHCLNTNEPHASCGEELWLGCDSSGGKVLACGGDRPTDLVAVFTPLVGDRVELSFLFTIFDPHE
jgi:hypothetical protein